MTENTPDAVKVETAGEMLTRLRDDGRAWAVEFRQTAIRLGYSDMDEGWLIGWFANAIENTEVVRRSRWEARAMQAAMPAPAGVPLIDAEAIAKAADDALVSGIHLVWEANGDARDVLLPPNEMRSRVRAAILSAIEGAGAREGAYDPERDLEPCLEARLFVTPESLDAFMEANPLPPDPTPAGTGDLVAREGSHQVAHAGDMMGDDTPSHTDTTAGDLVERLRITKRRAKFTSGSIYLNPDGPEAASRIEALEAERAALHAGLSALIHCQSALTRAQMREAAADILDKAGLKPKWFGGDQSPFVLRATTAEADLAALRAEVERVRSDREFIIGWNDGWQEAIKQNLRFPTMLRKMWSGGEVQAWIDKAMAEARAALSPAKGG